MVTLTQHIVNVAAIHVCNKVHLNGISAIRLQCFGHDLRAQEGAANTDCHNMFNGFTCVTFVLTRMNAVRKRLDFIQCSQDFWHDVFAINHNRITREVTQRGMQYGATFSGIDDLTIKHSGFLRVDALCVSQIK